MSELIVVASFNNRAEAELAKEQLEEAGIHSMVEADDGGGAMPILLAGSGGVKLEVNEQDFERAAEVLA